MAYVHPSTALANILEELNATKQKVSSGQLTIADYNKAVSPLLQHAQQITEIHGAMGSAGANMVNPGWKAIQDAGFIKPINGKWTPTVPFSTEEYNALPDNVLPTPEDVSSGNINRSILPSDRLRGQVPGGQPVVTDRGGLEGGLTEAGIDETKIKNESETARKRRLELAGTNKSARQAMLDDLTGLLEQSNTRQFNEAAPEIYEDLNSRGIFHSSGVGQALAKEKGRLASISGEQLALQGLRDRETNLGEITGAEEAYLGGREGALNRRFSLEDFDRQVRAGVQLGVNTQPKPAPTGGKASGAVGGALSGASAGSTFGPKGAIIGGIAGAVGGGQASKGK